MNREARRKGKKNYAKVGRGLSAVTASSFLAATGMSAAVADTVCNVSTLAQLQAAGSNADCDVISVNSNISFDPLEEDSQTVLIDHSVLIRGNVTIDGNRTGRMFGTIQDNIDVTFQGLNLIDGGWDVEVWQDKTGFGYDTFSYSGGTISTWVTGGGFYSQEVNVILDGVTIENSAGALGGAISLSPDSSLSFSGNTSYFKNNVGGIGGAVFSFYFGSMVLTNGVVFDNNEAINGGAIGGWIFNSFSTAEGVQFKNNDALSGGAIGGAYVSQIDIRESYFANNRAFDSIGELSVLGEYFVSNPDYLYGQVGTGGAINTGVFANLYIDNSTFFNNSADISGGAILSTGNAQVIFSTFLNNYTASSADEDSGASIRSSDNIRVFGNVFASDQLNRGHLNFLGGEGVVDLGGNLSTSTSDTAFLTHSLSSIVSFADLKISNMPSTDSSYPRSAPFLPIENTSVAADAVDLDQLAASLPQLIFPTARSLTRDQRGAERSGKYDAGAYEIGVRGLDIVPIVKKIVLPAAPARVTAKPEGRKAIKVEWALPTSFGTGRIMKYEIYRNGLRIATIDSNKRYFIDRALEPSQSYTYRIVSVGTQGNSIKSQQSSSIFPRK